MIIQSQNNLKTQSMEMNLWDKWAQEAYGKLESMKLLHPLRPFSLGHHDTCHNIKLIDEPLSFDEMRPCDRSTVEVKISYATFQEWLLDISSSGE